jgi:hypothetical protein
VPAERSQVAVLADSDLISRVVVASELVGQLSMVRRAAELARRHSVPLEIVGARVRVSPMIHFIPVSVPAVRETLARQAHQMVLRAVATVPDDVAATARLVDGKAWREVERMARQKPGEILAMRMNRSSSRRGRIVWSEDQTFVLYL